MSSPAKGGGIIRCIKRQNCPSLCGRKNPYVTPHRLVVTVNAEGHSCLFKSAHAGEIDSGLRFVAEDGTCITILDFAWQYRELPWHNSPTQTVLAGVPYAIASPYTDTAPCRETDEVF